MLPIWVYTAFGGVIAATALSGWLYYTTTQNKIEDLNSDIQILTLERDGVKMQLDATRSKLDTANNQIDDLKDSAAYNEKAYQRLDNQAKNAQTNLNRLIKLYQEHDLTKLATEKPGLIENRINEGTKNVFNELESITTPK